MRIISLACRHCGALCKSRTEWTKLPAGTVTLKHMWSE